MELRDIIVTPIIIILVYVGAFLIRPYLTDSINRKYFLPALTVRIIGALAVGFIYQFYYSGGDTYNFHTHGSRHVWEAFMDSPITGLKLVFANSEYGGDTFKYASQIPFYKDPGSYFIIRIAALLDLLTFSSYSATAVLFALISFIGMWLLFVTFYRKYPDQHLGLAIACFFIPSVFFWGSGLLKDTLMLACLGVITFEADKLFFQKKISIGHILLFIISLWCIFSVKKFILQAFLPALLFWVYLINFSKIRSTLVRVMVLPILIIVFSASAYFAALKIGEGDKRYAIENIAKTAKITAYDIGFQTGRDAGSGYSLGELDGSFATMLRIAPSAVNVTLFRPYLWEVNSPLMLLSAIESLVLILIIIWLLIKYGLKVFNSFNNPDLVFCLLFSIVFAFAVGISSYNFGTLSRYKIPLLPFLAISIVLIVQENKRRKLKAFDLTE